MAYRYVRLTLGTTSPVSNGAVNALDTLGATPSTPHCAVTVYGQPGSSAMFKKLRVTVVPSGSARVAPGG